VREGEKFRKRDGNRKHRLNERKSERERERERERENLAHKEMRIKDRQTEREEERFFFIHQVKFLK
jgi:hypothetical protein